MDIGRRHPDANPKGGVIISGDNDTGVVKTFLASLGKKILKGQIVDFMKFSRPAALSSGLTTLHTLTLDFEYTEFLK